MELENFNDHKLAKGWFFKAIGDLAHVSTGSTPPTNDKTNYGNEFFFVSPADLGDYKWINSTQKQLSSKGFNLARSFPKNSILFTCIGSTIGKSGIATIELTSNQQINAIFPDESYDSHFVYYALARITQEIKSQAGEQAVPMVNKSEFCKFKILLPPTLEEQKAIATALTNVDNLITNLDDLIAKKKAIKQGVMQQLLTPPHKGGKRLDGFDGEWEPVKLGDICSSISSGKSNTDSISGVFPIYGSTGIIGIKNYFDYQGERILVARVGANAGTLYTVKGKYCVSDNTLIIDLTKNINLKFIYYSLKLFDITQLIFGSGQPLVTGGQLKDIDLVIPQPEEQTAIASVLSDMDKEINKLKTKKEKYQHIKQGMMQELLTGKTRLV